MTVDHIIPCICCEHPPSVDDSVHYGMPVLKVASSVIAHKQFWMYQCPVCGRGGCQEFKSPYLALKDWNSLQKQLYETAGLPILYEEPWQDTCKRLGYENDEHPRFTLEEVIE